MRECNMSKEERINGEKWLAQQPVSIREILYIPEGSNYPAIKESALRCDSKPIDPKKPIVVWRNGKLRYATKEEQLYYLTKATSEDYNNLFGSIN